MFFVPKVHVVNILQNTLTTKIPNKKLNLQRKCPQFRNFDLQRFLLVKKNLFSVYNEILSHGKMVTTFNHFLTVFGLGQ